MLVFLTPMTEGFYNDSDAAGASASTEWSDGETADRCSLHRLIHELSNVQLRLGTPLERPEDFLRVRSLGAAMSEILSRLES